MYGEIMNIQSSLCSYAGRAAVRLFQIVFFCCLPLLCPIQDGYLKIF